jgi:hypothetical protein
MYSWSTSLSPSPRASSNPGDVGAHVVAHSSDPGVPVVCADSDEHPVAYRSRGKPTRRSCSVTPAETTFGAARRAPTRAVGPTAGIEHDQILLNQSENPADVA